MALLMHPAETDLTLAVPLEGRDGATIPVYALEAQVYDDEGLMLADYGVILVPGDHVDPTMPVTIYGSENALRSSEPREMRYLCGSLVSPDGNIPFEIPYAVVGSQPLVIMTNSFQRAATAELLALEQVDALGWAAATSERRIAAMIQAYRRITALPMRYTHVDGEGIPLGDENYIDHYQWAEITAADFATFPSRFRRALRLAQFIEAEELLRGDPAAERWRSGIVSETVAESSVTFRTGWIDQGVSSKTLQALKGYLHFDMRLAPVVIHPALDIWAENAGRRYQGLVERLGWIWQAAAEYAEPEQLHWARLRAQNAITAQLEDEETLTELRLADISNHALGALDASAQGEIADETRRALSAHMSVLGTYMTGEIAAQMQRDMLTMTRSLQVAALSPAPQRLPPRFVFRDRRGRQSASESFAARLWRTALLSAHNETVILVETARGASRVQLMRQTGEEMTVEGYLSLRPDPLLETYAEARERLFHPNARVFLFREESEMFLPNLVGEITTRTGRDVHARAIWGEPRACPFSQVHLEIGAQKTSVRADSSASRASADETVSLRAKILVPPYVNPQLGDLFSFEGERYEVMARHPRRTVLGKLDHYELSLEPRP